MRLTSPKGNEVDYTPTIEGLIKAEAEDPKFSFARNVILLGQTLRITYASNLCKALGTTYEDFLAEGFNMNDLIEICGEEGRRLGFFGESSIASDRPGEARS